MSKLEEKRDKLTERLQKHYKAVDRLRIDINQIDQELDKLYPEYARQLKQAASTRNKGESA